MRAVCNKLYKRMAAHFTNQKFIIEMKYIKISYTACSNTVTVIRVTALLEYLDLKGNLEPS